MSALCRNDRSRNPPNKLLASSTATVNPSTVMVTVARWLTVKTQVLRGMIRILTFAKLTPRSKAVKYRTSGADTDNTCGSISVNVDLKHTHLPGASVVIDSLWSVVKLQDAPGTK